MKRRFNVEPIWTRFGPALAPRFLGNVALTIGTRVALLACGIITAILTAKLLGPAGRGQYAYITTLGLIASQLGTMGLATNNARLAATDSTTIGPLAANTFWIALSIGSIAALAIFSVSLYGSGSISIIALASLFVVVPATLYSLLATNILVGSMRIGSFNFNQLIATLVQLVAIILTLTFSRQVTVLVWANAGSAMLAALFLWALLWRYGARSFAFDRRLFSDGLGYSGRVYVITLIAFLISRLNIVLLERFADHEAVGIYSVAAQFSDTMMLLPTTVAMILFPELVKAGSRSALSRTWRTAGVVAALMVSASLVVGLLAPLFIPFMFGIAFAQSAQVLIWLLPGTVALGVGSIFSQFLAARGVPMVNIWIWVASFLVMLLGDALLIPRLGSVGAAISVSCSYIFFAIAIILASVFDRNTRHNIQGQT